MADDHTQRPFRANEAPVRNTSGAAAGSSSGRDPLAELARLIGQNDPFAEFGRDGTRRAPPPRQPDPAPDWPAEHQSAPVVPLARAEAPSFSAQEFSRQPYGSVPLAAGSDLYQVEPHQTPAYEVPGYGVPGYPAAAAGAEFEQETFPPGNAQLGPGQDDYYDDVPPSRRRIGILAIAGVFALAVIGTAGAFGYRALFGSSSVSAPPPVIKAETAPSKIVPDSAGKNLQANKLITDRVNDRGQGEKLVSREEQPVAVAGQMPAAVGLPAGQDSNQGSNVSSVPQLGSGVVGSDPKRIRTIAIRPDQAGDAAPSAQEALPGPPVPQQTRVIPATRVSNAPQAEAIAEPAERPAAPASRQVAAPRSANAPLSLSPDAEPTRAAPAPIRSAAVAQPTPVTTNTVSGGGGYAVQVSSQRSEAEAQAAFRSLQGKYPDQLGSHQALIKRVDLGAKGIYFRAMVGPFGNSGEAGQLCTSLKSAGASCIVQRN